MSEHPFIAALALVLIIEGIMPFLTPNGWKNLLKQIASLDNKQLRIFGAVMMLTGAAILQYIKS